MPELTIGVYCFLNNISGKRYVGSASSVRNGGLIGRKEGHIRRLKKGTHHNRYFQRAWNKDGEQAFEFFILEICSQPKNCIGREQYWMDHYKSYKKQHGYNICKVAGSCLGLKATKATRLKMSIANKGRMPSAKNLAALREAAKRPKGPMSKRHKSKIGQACKARWTEPEFRAKNVAWRQGRTLSASHCASVSASLMGHEVSLETREKLRQANLGKKVSLETRIKVGSSMRGKKHSLETRAKISAANKGRQLTEEQLRKLSLAHQGKILTEEHKRRISEGGKGRKTSDETKARIAASLKGKPKSDEHRRKLSEALIRRNRG